MIRHESATPNADPTVHQATRAQEPSCFNQQADPLIWMLPFSLSGDFFNCHVHANHP